MNWVSLFVFCVGLCANLAFAKPVDTDAPISINLKLVAVVDGKSFFADNTTPRNWTEAKTYCESMGMKFAAITSQAQADALRAAYSNDFDGSFWTSGRDAHERRQFTWDSTGDAVSENFPEIWKPSSFPYYTCLYYHSYYDYPRSSTLNYLNCAGKMGALCSA